jgi:hypothetical protein
MAQHLRETFAAKEQLVSLSICLLLSLPPAATTLRDLVYQSHRGSLCPIGIHPTVNL